MQENDIKSLLYETYLQIDNDKKSFCVYVNYILTQKLIQLSISNFRVYTGYIVFDDCCLRYQHTWLESPPKENVIDFTIQYYLEYDINTVNYVKYKAYTPKQYIMLYDNFTNIYA